MTALIVTDRGTLVPDSELTSLLPWLVAGSVLTILVALLLLSNRGRSRKIKELEEIRTRMNRMFTAIEHVSEAIMVTDTDGVIQYVNPAFETITGYTTSEAIGKNPRMLQSGIQKETFYREMWDTILGGDTWSGRITNKRKDGTLYEEMASISPVRNEQGEITNFVAVKHDVSKRLQLEMQLTQAQKLESVGQLASGIAHEINTPIQYVGDNTRFLRESFAELLPLLAKIETDVDLEYLREEIPKALDESLQGIDRVTKIVRAMKEFSHPGSKEKTPTDINKAIQSTITVATNEWKYVAETKTNLSPDLPLVTCLPDEFNQVILNMIINAAHAIADVVGDVSKGKGVITISTEPVQGGVEVRIKDTGSGIPEAARAKIFDPFFTTKEVGKGTGQGLAIAHDVIVNKHGGSLRFETQLGQGTTFILHLPNNSPISGAEMAR